MQGIAHYTLSLLYLCALYLLRILISQHMVYTGLEGVVTFLISSDNKRFMISVFKFKDINIIPVMLISI